MADSDRDIEEKIDDLRALVLSRHQHIPSDAMWTVKEACVRLRGINPHALSDEELEAKLEECRTINPRTFKRKYLKDEDVRVWAVDTGSRGKRIPEKLLRQELDRRVEAGKPASYAQM